MSPLTYSLLLAHMSLLSGPENICLSPYSLQSAFVLVQEGAKGDTKEQITSTLDTKNFVILPQAEENEKNLITFEQANSIWINSLNCPSIKRSFLKTNEKKYQTEVVNMPFDGAGKQRINNWCSDKTHGRIPNAIDELPSSEVMELINAIYFKGSWVTSFNPRFTNKDDFYPAASYDSDPIQVDMMHNTMHYQYAEDELCQYIELPFDRNYETQEDEYVLQIVLPREETTLAELDKALAEGYELPELGHHKVRLALPKFEVNYSADLIPALKKMGMDLPFTAKANFKNISKAPLQISTVRQKTFFKVDETGAEAAAVTTIGMRLTSAAPRPEKVYEMTIDRPFLIQLVNKTRDVTLFVGNIFNPNKN